MVSFRFDDDFSKVKAKLRSWCPHEAHNTNAKKIWQSHRPRYLQDGKMRLVNCHSQEWVHPGPCHAAPCPRVKSGYKEPRCPARCFCRPQRLIGSEVSGCGTDQMCTYTEQKHFQNRGKLWWSWSMAVINTSSTPSGQWGKSVTVFFLRFEFHDMFHFNKIIQVLLVFELLSRSQLSGFIILPL